MNGFFLKESLYFRRLIGRNFSPDLKSIIKDCVKIVFYDTSRKILDILSLPTNHIKAKIKYYSSIWTASVQLQPPDMTEIKINPYMAMRAMTSFPDCSHFPMSEDIHWLFFHVKRNVPTVSIL